MVPRAKKNLHECQYHFSQMRKARHFEELEISFAAFVRSARDATWVLQCEFIGNVKYRERFIEWYGFPKDPTPETKAYEMANDDLCNFFRRTRNSIEKEGINGLICNLQLESFNSSTDVIDQPDSSSLIINPRGIYFLVGKETEKEDFLPAQTKGSITTSVFIADPPHSHLGKEVPRNDVLTLSEIYLDYLTKLIEEWTGIINSSKS